MRGSYVAGVVHHDDYDQLPDCLASLRRQTHPPLAVHVVDTGVDPKRLDDLRAAHPSVDFEQIENRGYGAGANRILARAADEQPHADYVLILNPDVALEPDFAAALLAEMDADPRVALGSGKLVRRDGRTLDSAGIRLPRHRRPRDRGSEEPDRGQYDRSERVFGVSGAAMMIRGAALADLALDGEVFDEDFFAYQDDTDLAWRAHRLGWDVLYHPAARATHTRRWQRRRRLEMPPAVRRHSFKNHYLQIAKNERGVDLVRNLPALLLWEALRLGYALARDRAVLPAYRDAWRALPGALAKRRLLAAREREARVSGRPGSSAPARPGSS
jgi:GT2 family glycosyltransferase